MYRPKIMRNIFTKNIIPVLVLVLVNYECIAQNKFMAIEEWQEQNTESFGGRSVLLILKDGKIIYNNAVNEMSRKQKFKGRLIARKLGKDKKELIGDFNEETKAAIASCSKWLSAALVMTFIDEGKLKTTDTVGKFLPILSNAGKGNITIAQCLSHTTGINAGELKASMKQFADAKNMDDAMGIIAVLPMDSKPGETFRYSNIGLEIAGAVIEKISAKDFKTLFAERIAQPCNMLQTDFGDKPLPIPAGSARSTALDYMHFLEMILNNGNYHGKQVVKKESINLMQRCYTNNANIVYCPEEAKGWGYGFGEWMMNNVSGTNTSTSVTSPGLFGTFPWIDTEIGYAAILFTFNVNSKGRNGKYKELKSLVDKAIEKN
jgi:CubicO group peptidase (beta-lactamase class C family)